METFESIQKRCSVRQFVPQAIDAVLLEKMVDAGRRAPTARAVEPWEFVVIQKKDSLERLGLIASNGGFIKDAAACIAVFCQDTKYYLEDGCAATENILLAATDLGIGSCWIAGDKKPYADEVVRLLGLPAKYKLVSLIALGYPQVEAQQRKNRVLKDVLHWEKF